jgi:2-keto-4-pentenoate hydratase/2-oxohepta-3-ene-1,7-dioic acid hydratase in catechol pathway
MFEYEEKEQAGILLNDKIVNLSKFGRDKGYALANSVEDLITNERETSMILKSLHDSDQTRLKEASVPLSGSVIKAPLISPPKIICLGLNYRDHVAEQKATFPSDPIIFMKPRTAIIGPNENIVKPNFVEQLDYEAELAIIIGQRAKNIPVSEAYSCIFGYTILNDVSARDIQFKDIQWTRGKGFDTFAPIGPSIVTKDQLQKVSNLSIRTWVDGQIRQNSTTANMIFNVQEIVHHLSRVMTLEPCDIIATGTPGGVGFAMKPEPKFLVAGSIVRIEIEGIGVLENTVMDEKQSGS